jgi:RNA polymerase sigma-70 factor (ECF subfamily)
MSGGESTTGSVLFALLDRPSDQQAWESFVERYGPKILAWCRGYHLQQADAEDITQQVLTKFIQKAQTFQYDPAGSFRAWLKTLTRHAVADLFGELARLRGDGNTDAIANAEQAAAEQSLVDSLDDVFERELLERAMELVQLRVEPKTWRAFELTTFEQRPGAEVATELNLRVSAVYMAKSRVQRMLKEQIEKMDA